jgi:hypothetical protein
MEREREREREREWEMRRGRRGEEGGAADKNKKENIIFMCLRNCFVKKASLYKSGLIPDDTGLKGLK